MGGAVTQLGQAAPLADAEPLPTSFCLERAQRVSSNAALTSARYHSTLDRRRGRRLWEEFEACMDQEVLGMGCNVEVIAICGRVNQTKYALKSFVKSRISVEETGLMMNEMEIYLGLDHPHIARLEGVYETDEEMHLVMECCEGGELYTRLTTTGRYSEYKAASTTRQILRALGYMHSRCIAHRDLKMENLLYENAGENSMLKLIDFGLAWAWNPDKPTMLRSCGSPEYVAPEVLQQTGYTTQCDLWSLGVITFILLVGSAPFPPTPGQLQRIRAGAINWGGEERWTGVSPDAVDFVRRLLAVDASARLTAHQAIFHPWLLRTLGNPVSVPTFDIKVIRSLQHYAAAPLIRRVCLQLVGQHLAPEGKSGLAEAFLGLDLGNEGAIRVRDLRNALTGQHGAPPALDEMLQAIDALGLQNEGIHYSEFVAATTQVIQEESARAVFSMFAVGDKGHIDAGDFEEALGLGVLPGGATELLREADTTGEFVFTGSIGFGSFLRILAGPESDCDVGGMVKPSMLAGNLLLTAKAALVGRPAVTAA